jgi:hypothetical protein
MSEPAHGQLRSYRRRPDPVPERQSRAGGRVGPPQAGCPPPRRQVRSPGCHQSGLGCGDREHRRHATESVQRRPPGGDQCGPRSSGLVHGPASTLPSGRVAAGGMTARMTGAALCAQPARCVDLGRVGASGPPHLWHDPAARVVLDRTRGSSASAWRLLDVVGRVGLRSPPVCWAGGQARALAFRRSNSAWSMAPASSSCLAWAICSAGVAVASPLVATVRT